MNTAEEDNFDTLEETTNPAESPTIFNEPESLQHATSLETTPADDAHSDTTSEPPASGEVFDLRDFFFDDAEAEEENASTADTTSAQTGQVRRRRRRRDTFVLVEDLPEGIDFDEPIEVERMTKIGRLLNIIVFIAFGLLLFSALVVLSNMAMTVMVVFYPPWPEAISVKAYNFNERVALLDFEVSMPDRFYTKSLRISNDPMQPLQVDIYLPLPKDFEVEPAQLLEEDRICTLFYDHLKPAADHSNPTAATAADSKTAHRSKQIYYDGSKKDPITAQGIQLKFNPNFDASRLGLLLEDKKHPQRPKRIYAKINVEILIRHFMMPITVGFNDYRYIDLDRSAATDDPKAELQAKAMAAFNFNPKEIELSTSEDGQSIHIKLEQLLPNCLMGSGMKIEVDIPEMNLDVFEFMLADRMAPFSFEAISQIYKPLAEVSIPATT
jgi:hypothetical protein